MTGVLPVVNRSIPTKKNENMMITVVIFARLRSSALGRDSKGSVSDLHSWLKKRLAE